MPTQEEISEILSNIDERYRLGIDNPGEATLAAAYRAEKDRNDCQNRHMDRGDRLLASERAEIARGHVLLEKAEARAELAERQRDELLHGLRAEQCSRSIFWREIFSRHEAERKALA